MGAFAAAFEDARSGLRLREQIGPRAPVGLSLNTLASIELSSNELTAARRDGQRALDIFNRINSPRGRGLAFTVLAEANRRASQLITSLQRGTSAIMLERASEYAEGAAAIFTNDVDEPARRMEALREKGRIYRAWARLRYERPSHRQTDSRANGNGRRDVAALSQHRAKCVHPARHHGG